MTSINSLISMLLPRRATLSAGQGFRRYSSLCVAFLSFVAVLVQTVSGQTTGPSSSASPYLLPTAPGVQTISIMTVGDSVNTKPDGATPYKMVGIPDGLGGYRSNGDTFTLLMNQEISVNTGVSPAVPSGVERAHFAAGAFVSRWTIDPDTLAVIEVQDFLQGDGAVILSNNDPNTGTVHSNFLAPGTTTIGRLCSANLADATAYEWTDPNSRITYGTSARIFQSGEEMSGVATSISTGVLTTEATGRVDYGRQFAFVATDDPNIPGDQSRTAYELPHSGLFAWENNLASPYSQRKTIVIGNDDGSPTGQVYVWVGDKQTTGNVVERAGLTRQSANDSLYVIKAADGLSGGAEQRSVPVSGRFSLENEGDVSGLTFGGLDTLSDTSGGTRFLRPEDGHWDPTNPQRYYFVTTDRIDEFKDNLDSSDSGSAVDQVGRSRLYMFEFDDITNPTAGGTITALLDGTEAHQMADNITAVAGVDGKTRILIQEDPGNWPDAARVWLYDVTTDTLTQVLQHDPSRFGDWNAGTTTLTSATAPFNSDEESSGIIDARNLIDLPGVGGVPGLGWFLLDEQAHYSLGGELVEGGQLLAAYIPQAVGVPEPGTLALVGLAFASLSAIFRRRT